MDEALLEYSVFTNGVGELGYVRTLLKSHKLENT